MSAPLNKPPLSDPGSRLRDLQETSDISPKIVELRLAQLRKDVPQAIVQIDSVRADDTAIAVKATIGLPGGARHSLIEAADVNADSSWSDQLAMVQAKAIAKALDGLQSRNASDGSRPARPPDGGSVPATEVFATTMPTGPMTAPSANDDHLPEYSWNAFWQTMNARNVSREQVEQALGKSVQDATPKEAVGALKAAGLLS
jgi:hypothetical protein